MNPIYVIFFLVLLIALVAILVPLVRKYRKEHYENNQDTLSINFLQPLGRNISFTQFGSEPIIISQRAMIDNSINTNPNGKCFNPLGALPSNDAYATVQEGSLNYTLKKTCMALNFKKYSLENNGNTVTFVFDSSNSENVSNLAKFLLINPLFVEFSFDKSSQALSCAYIPSPAKTGNDVFDNTYFSNAFVVGTNNTLTIKFHRALPIASGRCDKAMDYNTLLNPAQGKGVTVTANLLNSISNSIINLWAYYLDDTSDGFQKVGRSLPLPRIIGKGYSIQIYDKDYNKYNDPFKIETKEFMNNLSIMYNNYITPVLTFSFDIVISQKTRATTPNTFQQLLWCYVNNNYIGGTVPDCRPNNIMGVGFYPSKKDYYDLVVAIGDDKDCGEKSVYSPPIKVSLPYLSDNTPISIVVTLGPNQKHLYAQWLDVNSGDLGKKFVYAKTQYNYVQPPSDVCKYWDGSIVSNANNMTRMFSKKMTPRPSLENAYLEWNTLYVLRINDITHGYVNFNKYYSR
jgi:hypothetical protein